MPKNRPDKAKAPRAVEGPRDAEVTHESRIAFLLWLCAALLAFWRFGFTTMKGSDLWWHLASGRWIVQNRTLNFKDPWSFTHHGQPWLSHEWFADVIFHGWARWLGMDTLVWWKWSVLVGAFIVLFLTLRKIANSSMAAFLAALVAIAVGAPFFDIRPQLYSLLGFALLLRLALLPSRLRWLLPVVFFFWVNLHGGFFFGLLVLTCVLAVARLLGEAKRNDLPLWLVCLAVCLVNPNGPDAYVFSLHYAIHPKSAYLRVGEWKPLWDAGGIRDALFYPAIALFLLSSVLAFWARLHRKRPRLTYTGLALGLFTLAMALKSRRFIPLFGIAQSLTLAPLLALGADWARRMFQRRFAPRLGLVQIALPSIAVVAGVFFLLPYPLSSRAFLYLTSQDTFPIEAVNVAEANGLAGKVFAFYEWGGYLDLRTDGKLQVFIDGRADTVFDEQTYRRYTRVLGMTPGWEKIVEQSGADYFLWPKRHHKQIEVLRESGDWRTLYADQVAVLLIRSDLPGPTPLLPSPESAWHELAQGWRAAGHDWPQAEKHFQRALEMKPNLRMACEWLANAQAHGSDLRAAEATLDRCQRMFPDPDRRQELLALFHKRAEALP